MSKSIRDPNWRWESVLGVAGLMLGLANSDSVRAQAPKAQAKAAGTVTETQIEQAKQRGITFLRGNVRSTGKTGGRAALIAMTWLKAGVSADDPELQPLLEDILTRCAGSTFKPASEHEGVYEAGVSLMALANADPEKYKPQITAIANFLIAQQNSEGDWDYPANGGKTNGDTSISQYGMLGLWEAVRSGVEVPVGVWDKAAQWHVTRQSSDGGFSYHPVPNASVGQNTESTHSMTVAGTGSLLVARQFLFGAGAVIEDQDPQKKKPSAKFGVLEGFEEPSKTEKKDEPKATPKARNTKQGSIDGAIQRGVGWMGKNFTVTNPTGWHIYYLYGLERLGALVDTDKFGGRDWYQEGAAHLVATQSQEGSWSDQGGSDCGTCFAVLFLTKPTAKMVESKRVARTARFGTGLLAGGRGLPTNLKDAGATKTKARAAQGDIDKLLAELENLQSDKIEDAQQALVEQIQFGNAEELIGKKDRLLKLVNDQRPEVRRTALWALGRSNDLRQAPILINGLSDPVQEVTIEARNALKFLSKKLNGFGYPDEPTDEQRLEEIKKWKKWYLSVRPYDERSGLDEKD
jgi:hypothetical protein